MPTPPPVQTPPRPFQKAFTVSAPGTCANLGPGFDSFGLAIDWDNLFRFSPTQQDRIISSQQDIPLSAADNLVFLGVDTIYQKQGQARPPLQLEITANLPSARGLGSSSTAIVAGLAAGNHLLGNPYDKTELARIATALEGHPDNVAPAMLGGVKLCDEHSFIDLPWPNDWRICLLIPPYPIRTDEARRVLPDAPSRSDAIFNLRKASLLTYALLRADAQAFTNSLDDVLHQPYRSKLIPEWPDVQALAKTLGAFGAIISGSGSVMAVFHPAEVQSAIEDGFGQWIARRAKAGQAGIEIRQASVSQNGARVLGN